MGKLPGPLTEQLRAGDDLPVDNINFVEGEAFCHKLTQLGHQFGVLPKNWEFRLPTGPIVDQGDDKPGRLLFPGAPGPMNIGHAVQPFACASNRRGVTTMSVFALPSFACSSLK